MQAGANDDGSTSLFYTDEHGKKRDDGLHHMEPDNKHGWHEDNMQRAMKRGVSRESAFLRYGPSGCTLAEHDAEIAKRDGKHLGKRNWTGHE